MNSVRADIRSRVISWLVRDSGGGRARGLLRVWPLWEGLAHRLWPTMDIPGARHGLLSLHFTRYRGRTFVLPDGAMMRHGDPICELHMNNHAFLRALGEASGAERWAIVPIFRDDLRSLAAWIRSDRPPPRIKAIVGRTVLGRGAVRLGFTMRPRGGSLLSLFDRLFLDGLLILYTPEGQERMRIGKTVRDDSADAWMSITELLRRYGAPDHCIYTGVSRLPRNG